MGASDVLVFSFPAELHQTKHSWSPTFSFSFSQLCYGPSPHKNVLVHSAVWNKPNCHHLQTFLPCSAKEGLREEMEEDLNYISECIYHLVVCFVLTDWVEMHQMHPPLCHILWKWKTDFRCTPLQLMSREARKWPRQAIRLLKACWLVMKGWKKQHRGKGFWERFNHGGLPEVEPIRTTGVETGFPIKTCERLSWGHCSNAGERILWQLKANLYAAEDSVPFWRVWAESQTIFKPAKIQTDKSFRFKTYIYCIYIFQYSTQNWRQTPLSLKYKTPQTNRLRDSDARQDLTPSLWGRCMHQWINPIWMPCFHCLHNLLLFPRPCTGQTINSANGLLKYELFIWVKVNHNMFLRRHVTAHRIAVGWQVVALPYLVWTFSLI